MGVDGAQKTGASTEFATASKLTWESTDDPDELALYSCRCGAANCRGTMLDRESIDAKKKKEKRAAAKKKAAAKGRKPVAKRKRA